MLQITNDVHSFRDMSSTLRGFPKHIVPGDEWPTPTKEHQNWILQQDREIQWKGEQSQVGDSLYKDIKTPKSKMWPQDTKEVGEAILKSVINLFSVHTA